MATTRAIIDIAATKATLHARILQGVEVTSFTMYEKAEQLVPVRKVFKYRRRNMGSRLFAEQRAQGRQDVRSLSLEEALSESVQRRRLGLPSAFPTDSAGRRIPGSQSPVRTAQLTESYVSVNRANIYDASRRQVGRINGVNRIVTEEPIFEERVRGLKGEVVKQEIGHRTVPLPDVEADLSSRGRAELRRATPGQTLGGALRKSISREPAADTWRRIMSFIQAGGKDAPYAKYVEFGTRRSRAQPFMRPALALGREVFRENLVKSLRG